MSDLKSKIAFFSISVNRKSNGTNSKFGYVFSTVIFEYNGTVFKAYTRTCMCLEIQESTG